MGIVRMIAKKVRPGRVELTAEEIDSLLSGERRRVHTADPDTPRQWSLVRSTLQERPAPVRPIRPLVLRPSFAISLAATCAVVAAVILLLPRSDATSYATARGRQTTVLLSDSSEVILNHTTILQVRSATARGGRIVTLDGEAFFRVRKTGSPFVVNTSAGSVEVLGTAFNVRVREAVLELTVAEGRVELHGPKGTLIVEAGQVASCPADGAPVLSDRRAGPDSPGWIHGRFTFEKASLASVCREFEETFDVHISIRSRDLPAHTVTGTVEAHTAETALATLARLTGTRIEHENGGYTLY